MNGDIWNLPKQNFESRGKVFWDIMASHFGGKNIDVVEVGVYKAGMLKSLPGRDDLNVRTYVGVDPYLGDESDPYLNKYWKNVDECEAVFQEAKKVFERSGGLLAVDDSGNSDTPEVTVAINKFIGRKRAKIVRTGYRPMDFQNKTKNIPNNLSFVYFQVG